MPIVQPPKSESESEVDLFYREVGMLIKNARKKANNMTQEALALNVGLTRTSMTNVEKGRQKLLIHTLTRIAASLNVQPSDLLPNTQNLSAEVGSDFLRTLAPVERGFVERAITTGGHYAIKQTKSDQNPSKKPVTK